MLCWTECSNLFATSSRDPQLFKNIQVSLTKINTSSWHQIINKSSLLDKDFMYIKLKQWIIFIRRKFIYLLWPLGIWNFFKMNQVFWTINTGPQIHLLKTVNYKTEAMNIVYARFLFILISQKACKSLIYYRINGYHTEITSYYSLGKNRVHWYIGMSAVSLHLTDFLKITKI